MSPHSTLAPPSTISSIIICTSFASTPLTLITWLGIVGVGPLPSGVLERLGGGVFLPALPLRTGEPEI